MYFCVLLRILRRKKQQPFDNDLTTMQIWVKYVLI